jgi:hypothetical protein
MTSPVVEVDLVELAPAAALFRGRDPRGPPWPVGCISLINVRGRLVFHAGQVILRLPPGQDLLSEILARLRRLPACP